MEQILIGIPNKVRHVILPYMLNHLFHCFNVKGMFFPSQDVGGSKCSGPTGGHKGKLGVQVSVQGLEVQEYSHPLVSQRLPRRGV